MKQIAFLLAAFISLNSALCALLPPLYTSRDQICKMLSDPQFDKTLQSGEFIESIVRKDDGFVITTNKTELFVKVKSISQNMPGKAQFEYEFGMPVPRS